MFTASSSALFGFLVFAIVTHHSLGFVRYPWPSFLFYRQPDSLLPITYYERLDDVLRETQTFLHSTQVQDENQNRIESRTWPNRLDDSFMENSNFVTDSETESRRLPLLRNNPLTNLVSNSPLSTLASSLNWIDGTTCVSPNAEAGICSLARVCSNLGGRSSGSCPSFGTVCCINTVTRCGGVVTLNNTYWQAPASVSSGTACSLTVRLDPTLPQQRRNPICQVRLDFESFTIAQPNTQTVCQTDSFRVSGTVYPVPIICGQNGGQHMYLAAPSSTTDLQLTFTLGSVLSVERNWNIRIGLLPCSQSSILAPPNCLQYFKQSLGIIKSFNWLEVSPSASAPRQLANQDYNICFRTEQITNTNSVAKISSAICFAPCVITTTAVAPQTTPLAFSLTGDSTASYLPGGAGAGANNPQCANTDYVIIDNAVDSTTSTNFNDRFCGNQLSANQGATASATLCSTVKPFNIYYRTDGSEATNEFGNNGFCLRFEQRIYS